MKTLAVSVIPQDDFHKLQSLSRATRGGTLEPLRLAVRSYEMGAASSRSDTLNIAALEKAALTQAVEVTGGKIGAAARLLGIGKTTAYRKLKQFGLEAR